MHTLAMHTALIVAKTREQLNKEFGDRLKLARETRRPGISAAEAARQMRVAVPTYQGHENGTRGGRDNARLYAQYYRVNWRWLRDNEGRMEGDPDEVEFSDVTPEEREMLRHFLASVRAANTKKQAS